MVLAIMVAAIWSDLLLARALASGTDLPAQLSPVIPNRFRVHGELVRVLEETGHRGVVHQDTADHRWPRAWKLEVLPVDPEPLDNVRLDQSREIVVRHVLERADEVPAVLSLILLRDRDPFIGCELGVSRVGFEKRDLALLLRLRREGLDGPADFPEFRVELLVDRFQCPGELAP